MGLQSFFVFYGPSGVVSSASTTGITIQREVRESSDGPCFPQSNVSNVHMPLTSSSIGNTSAQSFHPSAHYSPSSLDIIRQLWPASITEEEKTHPVYVLVLFEKRWKLPHQHRSCVMISSFQTICTTTKIGQSGLRHPA